MRYAAGMREIDESIVILDGSARLQGEWRLPADATGVVLFAHGSGSSRWSPRNQHVAAALRAAGFGTLLLDLLTADEDAEPRARFDIPLLTHRLGAATHWAESRSDASGLAIGYFGASTGAAAALRAAAAPASNVAAVVSRGGRPDLAGGELPRVRAATLLIVGGDDPHVLDLNRQAARRLQCPYRLAIVPGATHLFEEPGALEEVQRLAIEWFDRHLAHLQPLRGARSTAPVEGERS
jgi:alpha-beta hydrolase superfamily lysophospholipase